MPTTATRYALASWMTIAAGAAGAGCAKDATRVYVAVYADATVPPILLLRTVIARAADPGQPVASDRTSPYAGDAADRPAPFVFPLGLPMTVDPSFAGPVVITVEGLDWDSHVVTAGGSGDAVVVVEKETDASVTLTAAVAGAAAGARD
jgi:hypothetical protein